MSKNEKKLKWFLQNIAIETIERERYSQSESLSEEERSMFVVDHAKWKKMFKIAKALVERGAA